MARLTLEGFAETLAGETQYAVDSAIIEKQTKKLEIPLPHQWLPQGIQTAEIWVSIPQAYSSAQSGGDWRRGRLVTVIVEGARNEVEKVLRYVWQAIGARYDYPYADVDTGPVTLTGTSSGQVTGQLRFCALVMPTL